MNKSGKAVVLLLMTATGIQMTGLSAEIRGPFATAEYTRTPPVVDGVLDEDCWKQAKAFDGFVKGDDNSMPAEPQTFFKIVYDQDCVYFGITALEPNISGLVIKPVARDVWPSGDSIEIFLDTLCDQHTYYQLVSNLAGDQYDGYQKDKQWDGDWETAVQTGKGCWTMEIAIPFATVNAAVPEKGDGWGFNLCRNGNGTYCTWAEVGDGFHNPAKYNTLVFGAFHEWWKKELTKMQDESKAFQNEAVLADTRLKQQLVHADQALEILVSQSTQAAAGTKEEWVPLYVRMKALQMKYREIADELTVIKALQTAGGSTHVTEGEAKK